MSLVPPENFAMSGHFLPAHLFNTLLPPTPNRAFHLPTHAVIYLPVAKNFYLMILYLCAGLHMECTEVAIPPRRRCRFSNKLACAALCTSALKNTPMVQRSFLKKTKFVFFLMEHPVILALHKYLLFAHLKTTFTFRQQRAVRSGGRGCHLQRPSGTCNAFLSHSFFCEVPSQTFAGRRSST